MKKYITTLLIVLILALNVQAEGSIKFLTIDFQQAFRSYNEAIDDIRMLQSSSERAQEQIDEMRKQVEGMILEYQELTERSNNPAFTDKASTEAEDMKKEIIEKGEELRRFEREARNDISQSERDIFSKHFIAIKDAVSEIARDRGVNIVFNSSKNNVVYVEESHDITDEVIVKINADSNQTLEEGATDSEE